MYFIYWFVFGQTPNILVTPGIPAELSRLYYYVQGVIGINGQNEPDLKLK